MAIKDNGVVYMPVLFSELEIFVKEAVGEGFTKIDAPVPGTEAVLLKDNYTLAVVIQENKPDAGHAISYSKKMIALNKK